MDITPEVGYINGLRNQPLPFHILLSELIDNSLDAGATRVDIALGPKREIVVRDDGIGCKSIDAMFTLGGRQQHSTTRLGRYGLGLKEAALYFWGVTTIETVYRGELQSISVDWSKVKSENKRWIAPDPEKVAAGSKVGTTITFSRIERNIPAPDGLLERIGYTFAPAIAAGRQIVLRHPQRKGPQLCRPYDLPPLVEEVRAAFEVDGRGVSLRVGIVADGYANKYPGFTYQHGHRSIKNCSLGARELSTSRIAGIVELDDKWRLSKNKDDVTELRDELGAAIFAHCESLLRKGDDLDASLESAALADLVSAQLSMAVNGRFKRKARRGKSPEPKNGTVEPKGSGRRQTNASKFHDESGDYEAAACSRVKVQWADLDADVLGKADILGHRVTLNATHALLTRLRREKNADAISVAAFVLYVDAASNSEDGQKLLRFDSSGFMGDLSQVLAGMPAPAVGVKRKGAP